MIKEVNIKRDEKIKSFFKFLIATWFAIFLIVTIYSRYSINNHINEEIDANAMTSNIFTSNGESLYHDDNQKELLEKEINKGFERIKYKYNILVTMLLIVNLTIGIISLVLYRHMRKLHKDFKRVKHLSGIDDLTHVFNRRKFDEIFTSLWNDAKLEKSNIALMLVDLDYFKEFNDNRGHSAGDTMLKNVGEILKEESSKFEGYVFRYGGDEFVILLPNLNVEEGEEAGNKILQAINEAKLDHPYSPIGKVQTVSIGVTATIPKEEINIKEFFNYADTALYLSKRYGRNRVSTWKI